METSTIAAYKIQITQCKGEDLSEYLKQLLEQEGVVVVNCIWMHDCK
jgi:hypothetical protein